MGDLKYTLHVQRENGKAKAQPDIRQNIYFETHNRICFAWVSEGVPASKPLHDCTIAIHPNGISVTGVERGGDTYLYQEWWLSPSLANPQSAPAPETPVLDDAPAPETTDSSTLSEVKEAFEAIQAAKEESGDDKEAGAFKIDIAEDPAPEADISTQEAELESDLEVATLEQSEEQEIMEELGISDEEEALEEDAIGPEDETLEEEAIDASMAGEEDEAEIGGFDDLAVLSDSELDALADEPAPDGDESDDMASIDGIDGVLDDAINEVLVDSDDSTREDTENSEPEEKRDEPSSVEDALSNVIEAATRVVEDDDDDMMLGGEPETADTEAESIMTTDELNEMLGDDLPADEDSKEKQE